MNRFDLGSSPSYAQMCRSKEIDKEEGASVQHQDIFLIGDISTSKNWDLMVTCKADGKSPKWKWCEEKVRGVFKNASFAFMGNNEALISLSTLEEVDRITSMPTLESWEGNFLFKKWCPDDGILSDLSEDGVVSNIYVGIHGLLYHLRTASTLKRIAQMWGFSNISNVKEGLFKNDRCGFSIEKGSVFNIPRILFVKEANRRFPVLIEMIVPSVTNVEDGSKIAEKRSGGPSRYSASDIFIGDQRQGLMLECTSNSSLSQPPGFERPRTHMLPQSLPPREYVSSPAERNSFSPLNSEEGQAHNVDFILNAPGHFQTAGPDLVVGLGEEPLNPVNHLYGQRQRRSRSLRRGLHIHRNPLGLGPRNQLIRNEIARLGNRRGRSRTRTVGKENVEAQAPGPIMNDAPSSSSNEVSKVCETPIMSTECGNLSSRRENLIREVAISLRRSSHEGDLRNIINWVVIPLAQDLGLFSPLGRVGRERLF
ncbi:hypothetical protein FRX31_013649 [Thalictrum thalictroides]|uniref:Uncharacterized protein n=1 Tax=Thalictrum thalictroides TaxID=46969 RepID=A0A7J6WH50_THATH|nr:hypothetical protein FRX31_013649 [Thalictrum thalictroides]